MKHLMQSLSYQKAPKKLLILRRESWKKISKSDNVVSLINSDILQIKTGLEMQRPKLDQPKDSSIFFYLDKKYQ